MSFKKTFFVAALAFAAGVHYSPKFYEEVEKREEDLDEIVVEEPGGWLDKTQLLSALNRGTVRAKLLEFYRTLGEKDHPEPGLMQSEADHLYRFAFDKGWSAASNDKANIGKRYRELFGDVVTAEEVQSEMRGG